MNKILSLEIFETMLFESDAEAWIKLCKDKKREWILTQTNQTDESEIAKFINNPKINKDCKCLDCNKNKKNESIDNGISKEIATVTEPIDNAKLDGSNNTKRQASTKKRKN